MTVRLSYEAGTIRVEAADEPSLPPLPGVEADPRSKTGRAPAYQYAAIRRALTVAGVAVDDHVPAWDRQTTDELDLSTAYELRAYQRAALTAWHDADERGVVELPTGAGKTVVAIRAMVDEGVPTLVVVPTIDLLEQWQRELDAEFDVPIGRFGGGEQR